MLRKNSWLLVVAAMLVALLLVGDSAPAPGPRPGPGPRLSWYERAVLWVLRRREPTPAGEPAAQEATDEFLQGNQPPSYVAGQIKHGDGW